uniref:Uncharacterized protein n=1 Tax=Arundo donax TaxID=35708 RepID=A0A0A9HEK6_ARUDO
MQQLAPIIIVEKKSMFLVYNQIFIIHPCAQKIASHT